MSLDRQLQQLSNIKMESAARDSEEKRIQDRRRNILVLILRHLSDAGYLDSVERLQSESGVSLSKVDAADNVDLYTILIDFEQFYEMRFGRKPRLTRKADGAVGNGGIESARNGSSRRISPGPSNSTPPSSVTSTTNGRSQSAGRIHRQKLPKLGGIDESSPQENSSQTSISVSSSSSSQQQPATSSTGVPPTAPRRPSAQKSCTKDTRDPSSGDVLSLSGVSVTNAPSVFYSSSLQIACIGETLIRRQQQRSFREKYLLFWIENHFLRRLLRPLSEFAAAGELRDLATTVSRDIISSNLDIRWNDIAGVQEAKLLLKEAVVMPIKYPQLFTGILQPWRGILLFGPPGTGKTMLAKAVATECKTTFFNISASTIVSKWRGDSEKLVRVLFELARFHSPSTIFIDEIDSIMSHRESDGSEHEGSRRMKTELLIQMDGLAKTSDQVFVLAASNLPWDLDMALLRRLEKRIHVGLPNLEARINMLRHNLPPDRVEPDLNIHQYASSMEGYSGSDIALVCKEAAMRPVRRLLARLESMEENTTLATELEKSHLDHAQTIKEYSPAELGLELINQEDFEAALRATRPSSRIDDGKYEAWLQDFGATM